MSCVPTNPTQSFILSPTREGSWCEWKWLQGHLEFKEASGGHYVSRKLFETTVWVGCDSGTSIVLPKPAADGSLDPQGVQESSKQPAAMRATGNLPGWQSTT